MNHINQNLVQIHQRIKKTCEQNNRELSSVELMIVTKTVPLEKIQIAIEAGEKLIGENKVQEGLLKYNNLQNSALNWHFIGHLQTNKIKEVLQWASCIQSVDNLELAKKLDQRLQSQGKEIDILLQVNTSYEESKFGVSPENIAAFAKELTQFETLKVKGLMTIGLFSTEKTLVRKCFQLLKKLQTELQQTTGLPYSTLSMGMSNDLELAIEEGSTLLRIGSAIFGERQLPATHFWNENNS